MALPPTPEGMAPDTPVRLANSCCRRRSWLALSDRVRGQGGATKYIIAVDTAAERMEWLAALRSNIGKANGRKQRVRADGSGKKAAAAIAAAAVGAAVRSPRLRQLQNQTASLTVLVLVRLAAWRTVTRTSA